MSKELPTKAMAKTLTTLSLCLKAEPTVWPMPELFHNLITAVSPETQTEVLSHKQVSESVNGN